MCVGVIENRCAGRIGPPDEVGGTRDLGWIDISSAVARREEPQWTEQPYFFTNRPTGCMLRFSGEGERALCALI